MGENEISKNVTDRHFTIIYISSSSSSPGEPDHFLPGRFQPIREQRRWATQAGTDDVYLFSFFLSCVVFLIFPWQAETALKGETSLYRLAHKVHHLHHDQDRAGDQLDADGVDEDVACYWSCSLPRKQLLSLLLLIIFFVVFFLGFCLLLIVFTLQETSATTSWSWECRESLQVKSLMLIIVAKAWYWCKSWQSSWYFKQGRHDHFHHHHHLD